MFSRSSDDWSPGLYTMIRRLNRSSTFGDKDQLESQESLWRCRAIQVDKMLFPLIPIKFSDSPVRCAPLSYISVWRNEGSTDWVAILSPTATEVLPTIQSPTDLQFLRYIHHALSYLKDCTCWSLHLAPLLAWLTSAYPESLGLNNCLTDGFPTYLIYTIYTLSSCYPLTQPPVCFPHKGCHNLGLFYSFSSLRW